MNPPSNSISASGALLGTHLRSRGLGAVEEFIQNQNPDGTLESIDVPDMPTVKIIRDDTPAKASSVASKQITFAHVVAGGLAYSVVQVA
jgi:hypothetical protein